MADKYLRHSVGKDILRVMALFLLIVVALAILFIIGLYIGYTVIGDGNYWEVLNRETWQHILDFFM